jgi:hypothetical protein
MHKASFWVGLHSEFPPNQTKIWTSDIVSTTEKALGQPQYHGLRTLYLPTGRHLSAW